MSEISKDDLSGTIISKVNKFLSSKLNNDMFDFNGKRVLRGCLKPVNKYKNVFINRPKKDVSEFKDIKLSDPFKSEMFKSYTKTEAQELMEKIVNKLPFCGTYALSCSCGSGKTLAGIYAIHKIKKQTLILSYRSAINTQWRNNLEMLYKNIDDGIIIKTKDGIFKNGIKDNKLTDDDVDIFIYTPQYILNNPNRFPFTVGLIIYDEIHTILNQEFSCAIKIPLIYCYKKIIKELPYMIGLSATFPGKNTKEYNNIIKIFGVPVYSTSAIVNIPIYLFDHRDLIKHQIGKDDIYDQIYKNHKLDSISYLKSVLNNENKIFNNYIEPTIKKYNGEYSGFVITDTISESVYIWLRFYIKYNKNCVLIREENDGYYKLKGTIPDDILNMGELITDKDIKKHPDFNNFCEKIDSLNGNDIMFGTYIRLKEGISVQNAVWGICSKFVWSVQSRVQILGRIRRLSINEELNNFPRYFIVNSGVVDSNIFFARKKKIKPKINYDFEDEIERYKQENYIKLSVEFYNKL